MAEYSTNMLICVAFIAIVMLSRHLRRVNTMNLLLCYFNAKSHRETMMPGLYGDFGEVFNGFWQAFQSIKMKFRLAYRNPYQYLYKSN